MSGIPTGGGGGDVTLAGDPNAFTGTNTYDVNRPTSTLADTPTATEFITKQDGEAIFGTGDAKLGDGTAVSPQTFTGFNKFDELTKFQTTRPQLANPTTDNPTDNDFITKQDGDDLYGALSGSARLADGDAGSPQTFTGFNSFEEITNFEVVEMAAPTGIATKLKQTDPNSNIIEQEQTDITSLQGNLIYQHGGTVNKISQEATGTNFNQIKQVGTNSEIISDGEVRVANIIVNTTAVPSSPFGGGNLNIETNTATTNGRLFIGTPPTNLPLFSITNTTNTYLSLTRGGIYVDGEEGIRIPRRGLYDRTGEREWRIDHYSGGGSSQSGTNCLTFNFSAVNGGSVFGNFLTKARLQSNGRLELDDRVLQYQSFSDARLKSNNIYLENATESLLKLSVQTYDKAKVHNFNLNEPTGETVRETGLIAQEVYYNAPEFRGLVSVGRVYNDEFDASGNQTGDGNPEGVEIIPDEMDLSGVGIGEKPDYEGAGWSKTDRASIEYEGFIVYLIKSNQELHERISILEAKINNM